MAPKPKIENFEEGLTRLENGLKELTDYLRAQKSGSRTIEVEKLILVDAEGKVRGKMGAHTDGSSILILNDKHGTPRTWLGVTPNGSAFLSLKNKSGRIFFEMPGAIPLSEASKEIPLADDISPEDRNDKAGQFKSSRTADDVVAALWSHIKTQLDNLELKSRRMRILGGILLSLILVNLTGLGIVMSRVQGGGSISTNSLVIHDKEGIRRAWLGQQDGKVRLELFDRDQEVRASLGLSAEGQPSLSMYDNGRKMLAELGLGSSGEPGLKLVGADSLMVAVPGSINNIKTKPREIGSAENSNLVRQMEPKKDAKGVSIEQVKDTGAKSASRLEPADAPKAVFLANPRGASYHYPGCPWIKNVPPDKLRKFASAKDAREAGYRPCRRCRPPEAD